MACQRGDALFPCPPDVSGVQPPLLRPPTDEPLVRCELVLTDLAGFYHLLLQEVLDLPLPSLPGHIHAGAFVGQVAVGLGDAAEAVVLQYGTDTRGVGLVHLVDAQHKCYAPAVLAGEFGEQGVFGGTGAAPLVKDQPPVGAVGVPAVRQGVHVSGGAAEAADSQGGKPLPERS